MPITAHPDIWALNFGEYFFAFKGVVNIYDYLYSLPLSHPLVQNYGTNFFTYPPLAYFTLGVFGWLLRPFANPEFAPWLMGHLSEVYRNPDLFKQLFLFKFPYLFFDLGLTFLLVSLFQKEREKRLVLGLWLLNPLALYTTFMIGQFDIIPVFLIVLALWLASKRRDGLAAIALGFGGAFKMFPLLLVLPLALVLGENLKKRARLVFLGILPYLIAIAPFLSSVAFRQVVLFSNQSQKMLFANLAVSGAEGIYLFVFFYFLICLLVDYQKIGRKFLWLPFLAVFLLFFSVTHYHPQWFLWLTPFLIIDLVINGKKHLGYVSILLFCYFAILLFFEPSLHLGLFAPLNPALAKLSGGLGEAVVSFYNPFQLKSLIRSLFAAVAFFLVYVNFRHAQIKKTN